MPSAQEVGLPPPDPAVVEAFKRGKRRVRYVRDRKSFGEFMLSDQVKEPVETVAKEIAALAKETANRDNSHKKSNTTHYADKFYVDSEVEPVKIDKALRVAVQVKNDDPVALYNEFGNKKSKRLRTLARAGAAFGDFKGKM